MGFNNIELKARIHKIFMEILQYTPQVFYVSTKQNFLCDTLSRNCVFSPGELRDNAEPLGKVNWISEKRMLEPPDNSVHNSFNILGTIRLSQVDCDLIALAEEQQTDPDAVVS